MPRKKRVSSPVLNDENEAVSPASAELKMEHLHPVRACRRRSLYNQANQPPVEADSETGPTKKKFAKKAPKQNCKLENENDKEATNNMDESSTTSKPTTSKPSVDDDSDEGIQLMKDSDDDDDYGKVKKIAGRKRIKKRVVSDDDSDNFVIKRQQKKRAERVSKKSPTGSTKVAVVKCVPVTSRDKFMTGDHRSAMFFKVCRQLAVGRSTLICLEEAFTCIRTLKEAALMPKSDLQEAGIIKAEDLRQAPSKPQKDNSSDGSSDEWGETEMFEQLPGEKTITITLKAPKKEYDACTKYVRQGVNQIMRHSFEHFHRLHVLCCVAHLRCVVHDLESEPILKALALSNASLPPPETQDDLKRFCTQTFEIYTHNAVDSEDFGEIRRPTIRKFAASLGAKAFRNDLERAAILYVSLRALSVPVRLVMACQPIAKNGTANRTLDDPGGWSSNFVKRRDYWVEAHIETKWCPLDPLKLSTGNPLAFLSDVSGKTDYVFAVNSEGSAKDVTARYTENFYRLVRTSRLSDAWIDRMLSLQRKDNLDDAAQRSQELLDRPLPKTLTELKNHPLYVLEKDLLRYEAFFPAVEHLTPVGTIRGLNIYKRSNVVTLQSEQNWLKSAKQVKKNEEPYKTVLARMQGKKQDSENPLYLHLYGEWQTEPFEPPSVENGIIPKNEYGNYYVYLESMVPKGCTHVSLPGMEMICVKNNIQHVPAVVGWENHGGKNHPVLNGALVLDDDVETIVSIWRVKQSEANTMRAKAASARARKNWRRAFRAFLRNRMLDRMFPNHRLDLTASHQH